LRQAWVTVRTPQTTIIASDGLSDPFDDLSEGEDGTAYNGFGLELYVRTPGDLAVNGSWQFDLVYAAAQLAADQGNFWAALQKLRYMTAELYHVGVPKEFQNAEGCAGALLGLPSDTIPAETTLSLETITIVNVKLLTLRELEYAIQTGKEGREKLAELIIKQGNPTYSDLNRKSVI
jgi:hypothetical protein